MQKKRHYTGYSISKRGKSYTIRVTYKGTTYNHTFHPPEGLTESKQYAAAEKEAIRLKDKILLGFHTKIPTFSEYANYVIDVKGNLNLRRSTLNQYNHLLIRLNQEFGQHKLNTITPAQLNRFYIKLQKSKQNYKSNGHVKDLKFIEYMHENNITQKMLSKKANVSINTIARAMHGQNISCDSINKICSYLRIDVNDYFAIDKASKPISSKTIRSHINLLNMIFKMAVNERIIDFNPVDASIPPKYNKPQINYYQPEEIAQIWEALDSEDLRWQVIISLLIVTGCRRGEIAGLRWDSILWKHNMLHINHEVLLDDHGLYTQDGTKNMDEKYVQVDSATMQLLKSYKQYFDTEMKHLGFSDDKKPQYCFYQLSAPQKPIYPSSINQFLSRFSQKNGFSKINPHAFRHSLASALIAEGIDVYSVSRQLGHKQVSTTREIYTHQINEHQAYVAAKIPEIYKKRR